MAKIYRRSDKLKIKIDDITIEVSPLSVDQKSEIQELMVKGRVKGDVRAVNQGLSLILKYGLKGISGVETHNGEAYALKFENGELIDECISDLMNMEVSEKIALVCTALVNKIPKEFTDTNGNKLEGVEFIKENSEEKK